MKEDFADYTSKALGVHVLQNFKNYFLLKLIRRKLRGKLKRLFYLLFIFSIHKPYFSWVVRDY